MKSVNFVRFCALSDIIDSFNAACRWDNASGVLSTRAFKDRVNKGTVIMR